MDIESGIRELANDFPQNSCHHAVFEFSGRRLTARQTAPEDALIKNMMLLPMFESFDVFLSKVEAAIIMSVDGHLTFPWLNIGYGVRT